MVESYGAWLGTAPSFQRTTVASAPWVAHSCTVRDATQNYCLYKYTMCNRIFTSGLVRPHATPFLRVGRVACGLLALRFGLRKTSVLPFVVETDCFRNVGSERRKAQRGIEEKASPL